MATLGMQDTGRRETKQKHNIDTAHKNEQHRPLQKLR
jgi:hypothetical protein